MLFLWLLYRRSPILIRLLVLAVFLIVFIATIVRVLDATHSIQERNKNVHTRSTSH
jgi:hypothetical protein